LRTGASVKFREPRKHEIPFDLTYWESETEVLQALSNRLPNIPQVLAWNERFAVHTYAEGRVLDDPTSGPVPQEMPVRELAQFFARLAVIPHDALPSRPAGWPGDGDSSGFLKRLVRYTNDEVRQATWKRYGALLDALGFPEDAMARFEKRLPVLSPRPFVLLHADLHPGNLIREPDGSLHVIDWELAMVGDPLHDLAIHLVRSRYPRAERPRLIRSWAEEVRQVLPAAVVGLRRDLPWYIRYQRIRSVYTDVVRTADAFLDDGPESLSLEEAAVRVRRILRDGLQALEIAGCPSSRVATRALLEWKQTS
jgi:aminoglycoside phosphotransferase (APT) family kinase protein